MTARLPYDTARCMTTGCPLADRCLRKSPGHDKYQKMSAFPGGTDCHGFIDEKIKP